MRACDGQALKRELAEAQGRGSWLPPFEHMPSDPTSETVSTMLFFGPLLLLLLCVERALARVHGQMARVESKGGGGVVPSGSSAEPVERLRSGSGKPSLDTLLKEDSRGLPPFDEAAPIGDLEISILRKIRSWVGDDAALAQIRREFLVCFVRGFADRIDYNEAAYAYLDAALQWRCVHDRGHRVGPASAAGGSACACVCACQSGSRGPSEAATVAGGPRLFPASPRCARAPRRAEWDVDNICCIDAANPPAERLAFEAVWHSGVVGHDAMGHPVVIERFCHLPPETLLAPTPTEQAFVSAHIFNQEALREYLCATATATVNSRCHVRCHVRCHGRCNVRCNGRCDCHCNGLCNVRCNGRYGGRRNSVQTLNVGAPLRGSREGGTPKWPPLDAPSRRAGARYICCVTALPVAQVRAKHAWFAGATGVQAHHALRS